MGSHRLLSAVVKKKSYLRGREGGSANDSGLFFGSKKKRAAENVLKTHLSRAHAKGGKACKRNGSCQC